MSYAVKEIFLTLQGEGAQAGRKAVFVRFAGCNLWNGREEDRGAAECTFCDTDFVGTDGTDGGRYADAEALASQAESTWGGGGSDRYVVLTGGEPLLQVDAALTAALKARGFTIAIETNGTKPLPQGVDWVCVSPKAGTEVVLREGSELKLVYPQPGLAPDAVIGWRFGHYFLQPMDGERADDNRDAAIEYVMLDPRWRLGVQTHKLIGLR